MSKREASIKRKTNETDIELSLNIDGTGICKIETGMPFFEHMLEQICRHGQIDLNIIAKGDLVADELILEIISQKIADNKSEKGIIFDGFPRTEAQAQALETLMTKKQTQINAMVALEVDDELLVGRLLSRGKESGRADDANETVIRERIAEYYRKTDILKRFYIAQNKYQGVNGVGAIEEITQRNCLDSC